MTQRHVLTNPDSQLRKISKSVLKEDILLSDTQTLIRDLIDTMQEENGVGIAAPQVGVHKQVIIVETGSGPQAFINPKITSKSFWKIMGEEGCLSVPGVFGIVRRHKAIKVIALNDKGQEVTIRAEGFLSVVLQHEIDHLNGILFIDKVRKYTHRPRM